MAGKINTKRRDKNRIVLKTGESQRKDGSYDFRWTDAMGKRHSTYAKTLTELREKEKAIERDSLDNIRREGDDMTVGELFRLWFSLKRGIRNSTMQHYTNSYKYGIAPYLEKTPLKNLTASCVKRVYIDLLENQNKSITTIEATHRVLMQALDFAADDHLLKTNPAKKVYTDFKREANNSNSKKSAMTRDEQMAFFSFISSNNLYRKWENLMIILNGTGMRIGEALALQWEDIDFERSVIRINKTLIYLRSNNGAKLQMHPPKTKASIRQIPMSTIVSQAFKNEKVYQENLGVSCIDTVDGYSNFVFISRNGHARRTSSVDLAIKQMVAKYNKRASASESPIFLPDISCHTFRHNFATRLFECGVEPKIVQSYLGHSTISITMDIYTDFFAETQPNRIISIDQFLTPKFTPIET